MIKKIVLIITLVICPICSAQSWSSIVASSRAIDWTHAGLPATLPTGETTTNPWTPPARLTQCGSTISAGASLATVNAALAACTTGQTVVLGAGTFTFNGASSACSDGTSNILMYNKNGVTLRGSGPQSTIVNLTGAAQFCFSVNWSTGTQAVSSGATQGSTSITVASISGGNGLVVGQTIIFNQCNTGLSGATCTTGAQADNGGAFVCAFNAICSQQTSGANVSAQTQTVLVTAISGTGPFTLTFSPALRLPNWASGQNPTISWNNSNNGGGVVSPNSIGLEDMTVSMNGDTANAPILMNAGYANWVKGVRIIGIGASTSLGMVSCKSCLLTNSYIYAAIGLGTTDNTMLNFGTTSDSLAINNILTGGVPWEGNGGNSGNVVAYNFSRHGNTTFYQDSMFEHHEGSSYFLIEGNQVPKINADDTWGTHLFETAFRNYLSGADPPYVIPSSNTAFSMGIGAFSRFANYVGNSAGSAQTTTYQSTISAPTSDPIFEFNNGSPQDTLTETGTMRWGNCDLVTNTCRNQSSEVPTTLSGNAVPFQNTVPGSTALPCSFFLSTYTSTTCTPHPTGGTGLSFWKICKTWTTFPTTCATTQINPFPATGPDVTGGVFVNGTSYDIPAGIAYNSLPIDTTLQQSFTITSSSWTSGVETLTITGLPTSSHIIGEFQVSGGACSTGSGEATMTASTATTVSYALASNPGACTGTMKFPDVRQFDERVFINDPLVTTVAPSSSGGKGLSGGLGSHN